MIRTLLIHNIEVSVLNKYDQTAVDQYNAVIIDNYSDNISFLTIQDTLYELQKKEFDVLYIKDNLTVNGMDFYGLVLAYHIRLSIELEQKRYVPIIILSDLDGFTLNKLSEYGQILFTKNIFLNQEPKSISEFNESNFDAKFLNKIEIKKPKDISSNHDIANEWSIYKWAQALAVSSDSIQENKEKIHNTLYFKYLVAKGNIDIYDTERLKTKFEISNNLKKKIVSIDDKSKNGWRDIFKNIFKYQKKIQFQSFNYEYNDKSYEEIEEKALEFIKKENPDVVILDLRLSEKDYVEDIDIEEISGIKLLQKIHKINAGIQIIMLTATGKSTILEKLYEYKILGYIKKEHPDDKILNTKENIEKFIQLANYGFKNSYLKEVWKLQQDILKLDILKSNNDNYKKISFELSNVFNILDSNLNKQNTFFILAIYNSIEIIVKEFGYTQGSTYKNITTICQQLDLENINEELSKIICTRNFLIHLIDDNIRGQCIENTIKEPTSKNLIDWLGHIHTILEKIDKQTK